MKKLRIFCVMAIAVFCAALSQNGAKAALNSNSVEGVNVRMSFEGGEVLVALYDSQASRELVAMLPLTLSFGDYAGAEKIAYLPQKLSSGASPSVYPEGDFTYYAPWGNLAVFYKGHGRAGGLYILGKIVSGKEILAGMNHDFTAAIEVVGENQ